MTTQHVLFAPDLGINRFSIAAVTNFGWDVHFIRYKVILFCNQVNVAQSEHLSSSETWRCSCTSPSIQEQLCRLAFSTWEHQNDIIKKMAASEAVDGLTLTQDAPLSTSPCHGSILGKMKDFCFPAVLHPDLQKLANSYIVTSVVQCNVKYLGDVFYFLTFKDNFIGYRTLRFLKVKSEVAQCFQAFVKLTNLSLFYEPIMGVNMKILRFNHVYGRKEFTMKLVLLAHCNIMELRKVTTGHCPTSSNFFVCKSCTPVGTMAEAVH